MINTFGTIYAAWQRYYKKKMAKNGQCTGKDHHLQAFINP